MATKPVTLSDVDQERFNSISANNPGLSFEEIMQFLQVDAPATADAGGGGAKAGNVAAIAGTVLSVAEKYGGDDNPLKTNRALSGGLNGAVQGAAAGAKVGGVPGAIIGGVVMGAIGASEGNKEQKAFDKQEKIDDAAEVNYQVTERNRVSTLQSNADYSKKSHEATKDLYGFKDVDNFVTKYSNS